MAKKTTKLETASKKLGEEIPDVVTSDGALAEVSRLAKLQHEAELYVASCEDELQEAKDALRQIKEDDLPTAMLEAGLKKFTTEDGLIVERKSAFTASITKINEPMAYNWLKENGFAGIIKTNLDAHFDRGDSKKADQIVALLRKKGVDVDVKETIHASTLKSFVTERMEDTESDLKFPQELFGCYPYNVATVKAPGTKKRK